MSTPDDAPTTPKATAAKATTRKASQPKAAVAKAEEVKTSKTPEEPKARPKAEAAPIDVAPPSAEAPTGSKRPRGLLRVSAIAGVAVLGVATLYLLTMTVLWGVHHHALTGAQADLSEELAAQQAIVDSQAGDLETAQGDLTDALDQVSNYALQKAKGQDDELVFRNNDQSMSYCATERVEVVSEVKNRGRYITWTLHRYDDEVATYCNQAVEYFTGNIELESASS
jgi:hypothetical protein